MKQIPVLLTLLTLPTLSQALAQNAQPWAIERVSFSAGLTRIIPNSQSISFTANIPADFPEPSKKLYAQVDCLAAPQPLFENDPKDVALFDKWVKNAAPKLENRRIVAGGIDLSCDEKGVLSVKAGNWTKLTSLFSPAGEFDNGVPGGEAKTKTLNFVTYARCAYPEIRMDCSLYSMSLSFEKGEITASDASFGAIVAVRQAKDLLPVVFEGKVTPVKYDPAQPVTVWVKTNRSDFWQVLTVEYAKGALSWWQTKDAPTN